jgi:hypothetical protein
MPNPCAISFTLLRQDLQYSFREDGTQIITCEQGT